jgi:hypothetical protein
MHQGLDVINPFQQKTNKSCAVSDVIVLQAHKPDVKLGADVSHQFTVAAEYSRTKHVN